jgi:hypothetical protein
MLPDELSDARAVEALTGLGFSEVYHRHFAPQMRAAAQLLREVQESGMTLDRSQLRDIWVLDLPAQDLAAVYSATSELAVGD